jgi:hypothetical protein
MKHYEEAGNLWQYKFAVKGTANYMVSPDDGAMINQLMRSYPAIRSKVESFRDRHYDSPRDMMKGVYREIIRERLSYSTALSIIWQEASEELKKAPALLQ